jgi:hypothetical protein
VDSSRSAWRPSAPAEVEIQRLGDRLDGIEEQVAALGKELRTRRLVVTAEDGSERLVVELVAGVLELRAELPPAASAAAAAPGARSRRSAVLIFANPGQADLAGGVGLQVWGGGDLVRDLSWWEDEHRPSTDQPAPAPYSDPSGSEMP